MTAATSIEARWAEFAKRIKPVAGSLTEGLAGALRRAERLAAVTLWFNPGDLWRASSSERSGGPDIAWLEHLRTRCSVDALDAGQWVLLDRERLPVLSRLRHEGQLIETCERAVEMGESSVPRMIIEILRGDFEPVAARADALAVATEVVRWLDAIHVDVDAPSAQRLTGMLEVRSLHSELDFLAHQTVGRDAELRKLTGFVRRVWRAGPSDPKLSIFILEGVGGIGKSTLAADFARNHLPKEHDDAILLWIDYDRLRVRPEDVGTVLMEIARQLGWAIPEAADALRSARAVLRSDRPGSDGRLNLRAAIDTIAEAVVGSGRGRLSRPVLLVLDTFEQVERVPGQTTDILGALDSLRSRMFDNFAVLACGRSLFTKGFGEVAVNDHTEALHGLGRTASMALLTGRGGLGQSAADSFLGAFDDLGDGFADRIGVPMLLMLIARLIRDKQFSLEDRDIAEIRAAADATMATAYIYGRILERLPDDLKALAHPGLAVPEVSPDLIEHVVWPAVHPERFPVSPERAADLYHRLSRETWLVDPVPGSVPPRVRHRPDLRRAMLEGMRKDGKTTATMVRLHERARDWHRSELGRGEPGRTSDFHRLGQVYHALQRAAIGGGAPGVGMVAVRRVRDQLAVLVEDFPAEFQPAVRALLGEAVEPGLLEGLDGRLRTAVFGDRVREFALRGDPVAGIRYAGTLDRRDRAATPSMARWILRLFLGSGRWTTAAPVVADLVDHPHAVAFNFGRGRPSLTTFVAAAQVVGLARAREALRTALRPDLAIVTAERYEMLDDVLALLERPDDRIGLELLEMLGRVVLARPPRRATGEALLLAQIFGALQRRRDPGRHDVSAFAAAAKRGAHSVGIATLEDMDRRPAGRSSAQLVSLCRSLETQIDRGNVPLHVRFVTVFDEFHGPIGEALAASVSTGEELFKLAERAWDSLDVRPPDLRPSRFVESCADPRQRRERMRTLTSFLDRAGRLDGFLDYLVLNHSGDPDLAQVARFVLGFRRAFHAERT